MSLVELLWSRLEPWFSPRYAWRRIRHNLLPKLLSLGVAALLWLISTGDERARIEQSYDVPITVRDTTGGSERRAVSGLNPPTVRVTLSGRPERLRELRGANIEAVLDVTGVPQGSFNRPVTVQPPADTALARQTPERAEGFVDTELSRTLPVTISVATPSENSLPRYTVSPTDAEISGPARVLTRAARVVSSPPSLSPGEQRETPLIALDAGGNPLSDVRVRPSSVTVRRVDTGEVPIKALRVVLDDPPPNLKVTALSVQPQSVRVVAAPELLARLREIEGRVNYRPGTYTAPVSLRVPPGAQALETVSVRLTVEPLRAE